MTDLKSLLPEELEAFLCETGESAYRARQVFDWVHRKDVADFAQMTDLPLSLREKLARTAFVTAASVEKKLVSARDGTVKFLFGFEDGEKVESVLMRYKHGNTVCISTQAGCRMGCKFCMTGRQGFHGNLTVADILSQFIAIDEAAELTNAVFMGMGEPLDNFGNVMRAIEVLTSDWGFGWSPKRITLSTIGVLPNLRKYLDSTRCHLAVSLHNPFPDERAEMMPVQKAWPVQEVIDMIREYDFTGQRRVSFEYTMFAGLNDDKRHADALIRLLRGLECRVNLIRFHKIPDSPFETTPQIIMERFRDRLSNHGITCTIRASRGEDILAACGMLAGEHSRK